MEVRVGSDYWSKDGRIRNVASQEYLTLQENVTHDGVVVLTVNPYFELGNNISTVNIVTHLNWTLAVSTTWKTSRKNEKFEVQLWTAAKVRCLKEAKGKAECTKYTTRI